MRKRCLVPTWFFVAAILVAAAVIYFYGVFFFRTHFPFKTTFLGMDVSQQTEDVIEECIEADSMTRNLTIQGLGGTSEVLNLASSIDYQRIVETPEDGWISGDLSWSWPVSIFAATELASEESFSYSPEKLEEAVASLEAMDPENVTSPHDAYIQWDDGICYIVPEVDGNELATDKVIEAVKEAIESEEDTVDLEAEGCYKTAKIRRDDETLNAYVDKFMSVNFQQVTIDMSGTEVALSSEEILSFYGDETVESGLDREKVSAYVAQLKEDYDTYESQRPFVNHYGTEIMVGTGADTYGFRMDQEATTDLLMETLESMESVVISPVWTNEGVIRDETGCDIGDTYIEVSISDQHLWGYIDGEQVLETDVVTGTSGSRDTPRGVFRILSKAQNTYLTGPGYSSFVNYWMQIVGGVGLHDASWRSTYGGTIYTYNGSHGCVNMPYAAAQEAFNTFEMDTPVVVW